MTTDDFKAKVMCHDYSSLFEGLGTMTDEYTIKLKDDVKPFTLTVPKKVPTPLYEDTTHKIARMLESRVISPVDHLTEWCATMVVTTKVRSEVRVCVDLTKRNEYVQHENHSLPSVDLTLGKLQVQSTSRSSIQIPDSGWKLKDHSRPSSHLGVGTVLMCCLMDLALVLSRVKGLEGVECNIDDVLVHVPTIHVELHDYRLERLESVRTSKWG